MDELESKLRYELDHLTHHAPFDTNTALPDIIRRSQSQSRRSERRRHVLVLASGALLLVALCVLVTSLQVPAWM